MSVNCAQWRDSNVQAGGICAAGVAKRPSHGWCNKICKQREPFARRDVVLRNWQGAGDQVMLTAAIRDLHRAAPDRFRTAVEVWGRDLFDNNPHVTPRELIDPAEKAITIEGFEASDDNQHVIFGFHRTLGARLNVHITPGRIGGDIYLSGAERASKPTIEGDYWLWWVGGHYGFSTKWWDPREAQKVVDHFKGRLTFVQVGCHEHWHQKLAGAVDMIGKTAMRDMVKLMYHALGVISPISFGMHLAAAVPTKPGAPLRRACVVIAGGRESVPLIQYPTHTVLHTIGGLRCCLGGACWANVSHNSGGRKIDCQQPLEVWPDHVAKAGDAPGLQLARCMTMIKAQHVIDAVEKYLHGIEDFRRDQDRRTDVVGAAAAENMPKCLACPNFAGVRPNRSIGCLAAHGCCGESVGSVDLGYGRCPLTPPKWIAGDSEAWQNWKRLNPYA